MIIGKAVCLQKARKAGLYLTDKFWLGYVERAVRALTSMVIEKELCPRKTRKARKARKNLADKFWPIHIEHAVQQMFLSQVNGRNIAVLFVLFVSFVDKTPFLE